MREAGETEKTIRIAERGLALARNSFPAKHDEIGQWLNNLGMAHATAGDDHEALPLLRESVAIAEHNDWSRSIALPIVLDNLAAVLLELGQFAEASALVQRSLEIFEDRLGKDHEHTGLAMKNLANLYGLRGKVQEQVQLLRAVLEIREKKDGVHDPRTAQAKVDLAQVLNRYRAYEEAIALLEGAIPDIEPAQERETMRLVEPLNQLGQAFVSARRASDARRVLERAKSISERLGFASHPHHATTINNLAFVYRIEGNFAAAGPLLERALELRRAAGSDTNVIDSLANVALNLIDQKKWKEALPFQREAVALIAARHRKQAGTLAEIVATSERDPFNHHFANSARIRYLVASDDTRSLGSAFLEAQWASRSAAAVAMQQMTARAAVGNSNLAAALRKRQDLLR